MYLTKAVVRIKWENRGKLSAKCLAYSKHAVNISCYYCLLALRPEATRYFKDPLVHPAHFTCSVLFFCQHRLQELGLCLLLSYKTDCVPQMLSELLSFLSISIRWNVLIINEVLSVSRLRKGGKILVSLLMRQPFFFFKREKASSLP